jgi:hypothetical protein
MDENSIVLDDPVRYREYLVENAARCCVIARASEDNDLTRSIVALGREYAAQALARGADPARLPGWDQWRWITDHLDRQDTV